MADAGEQQANHWKSKKREQLAGSGGQMILHYMLRHLTKGFRVGSLQLASGTGGTVVPVLVGNHATFRLKLIKLIKI